MLDSARHRFELTGRRLTRRDFVRIARDVAVCIALGDPWLNLRSV